MRFRRRKAERGAALLIVVLVIMALTGVAMFAAKSASTDVEVAGRYRQAMQTHQVGRIGMQAAFSELSRDPETYIHAMSDPSVFGPSTCVNQVKSLYVIGGTPATGSFNGATPIDTGGCYTFHYDTVQTAMTNSAAGAFLVDPGVDSLGTPNGLGSQTIRPDFVVEMTDKDTWDQPVMGFAAGSGINMKFYTVTMSGRGMILPRCSANDAAAGTCVAAGDGNLGSLAVPLMGLIARSSVEDVRAQVMVGPLPAGL